MTHDPNTRSLSRRQVLAGSAALFAAPGIASGARRPRLGMDEVSDVFPRQEREPVLEVVGRSHFDFDRVKELVEARPALAKSSIDWGFGDWESALGAASHTGRREIAEFLMKHGARPNLFTHAMLGHVDVVRAIVESSPGIDQLMGPHSISLLRHARSRGEDAASVVEYLLSLPGGGEVEPIITLTEDDLRIYLGEYVFGAGFNDRFMVTIRRGALSLQRKNGVARMLTPVASHTFHPAGAEAVRIVFHIVGDNARSVTVHDPDPIVVGKRIGA